MSTEFQKIVDQMEPLLAKLQAKPKHTFEQLYDREKVIIPKQGVYVFYEEDKSIYVGRSNRMRERIIEHGSLSPKATFMFKLVREKIGKPADYSKKNSWKALEKEYPKKFKEQQERVLKMKFQSIEIVDQQVQTVFEIYAIISLTTTRYNTFHTT